ncbi:MAG: sulfatase-like hydrolase/transferase [Tannerella sp.]|jgi:arylsulfatase|nr:sulfatase-like hydrolase/transferase [Tannerella sp.]
MEKILTSKSIGILSSALLVSGTSVAQYSPQQSFTGKTGKTLEESIPAKIEYNPKAVAGSPNVVWILIDDAGFGATTPFGGLIETPNIERLANNGLRFTNFHTTGISSPTRAALLTGRNHHSVHIGLLTPAVIDFPGYDTRMPFEKATVAEILRDNGYNTFALGKWHVAPVIDNGPAGPFNRWPTGRGFDNYFGFLPGATDQWHPELWEDQTKQPQTAGDKHLNELLADKAIKYIANQKSGNPEKPFFLYLATGATHSPHQVAREWIDKYKGKFDEGWDVYREKVIKRQKEMGIVPSNAVLPEHNTDVKPWKSLSSREQKAMVRFMETYAGFYSYTDYEIGRIVDYLDNIDLLDNTVFIVILGDNGASRGGGQTGNINPAINRLNKDEKIEAILQADNLGTDGTRMDYPVGWAQAANTPFRWYKASANSEGGTRNPVIIHYPNGIKDKGGIRHQYGHVIDILPTTLDILGIQPREVINGYRQQPIEGVSVAHSFEQPDAPSKHLVQYFEIASGRAIYYDGWKATAPHRQGNHPEKDVWELYNLKEDFNERINLVKKYPEKLKELQDVFDREAKKYNIYPLKDFSVARMPEGRTIYGNTPDITLYPGVDHLWGVNSPLYERKSFVVTAQTEIVTGKEAGVLFAIGGDQNGISLFIKDGKLHLAHKNKDVVNYIVATEEIPVGKVSFRFDYEFDGSSGGRERLFINDKEVGVRDFGVNDARITGASGFDGTDVGRDLNHPVSDKYASPFPFTGKIKNVKIHYTKLYNDDLPERI